MRKAVIAIVGIQFVLTIWLIWISLLLHQQETRTADYEYFRFQYGRLERWFGECESEQVKQAERISVLEAR